MKCAVHTDREAVGGCCSCGRFVCPECKVTVDNQVYCNPCMEAKLKTGSWPGHTAPLGSDYTSGLGALSLLPPELRGWNWGAFLLTWIWGIGHNVWIALVALGGLIPYVGWIISIVMAIVLGVRGNEWAWQNKKWDSIEQLQENPAYLDVVGCRHDNSAVFTGSQHHYTGSLAYHDSSQPAAWTATSTGMNCCPGCDLSTTC